MRDKDQKMRFNSAELAMIKGLFANNDELIYAIRKTMLQMELSVVEKAAVAGLTAEAHQLIAKTFMPELDGDSPIAQLADLRIGLDIKGLSPDGAWPFIKAKELEIEYINQQLEILQGRGEVKIKLSDLSDLSGPKTLREQKYINLTAWNFLISFVDGIVNQLKILAGTKEETVEETMQRLAKNSNK